MIAPQGEQFKPIKNNRFDNYTFLTFAGYHGLQFNRIGQLYAFGDEFIQIIKLDFPFKEFKLTARPNTLSSDSFVNLLPTTVNNDTNVEAYSLLTTLLMT